MIRSKPARKSVDAKDAKELANNLNTFYARFDHADYSAVQQEALGSVRRTADQWIVITTEVVRNCFKKTKSRKACGPDHIPGTLLTQCHSSLLRESSSHPCTPGISPCYGRRPSCFLSLRNPPQRHWMTRPVALTSIPFKCVERFILQWLLEATCPCQDPLQSVYKANRSTEDAILAHLNAIDKHLEKPRS